MEQMKGKTFMNLNRYQYVSFDIFDTILRRSTAHPTDIFRIIETYCQKNNIAIPQNFTNNRINAEMNAYKKFGRSATIEHIYNELENVWKKSTDELKSIEIQLEINGCRPAPYMVKILEQCINSGKTVILISDMYLTSDIIIKMLNKCNIHGYSKLYVSCEHNCSKSENDLYLKVLNELDISPNQIIHIGDNFRSDFINPIKLGIRANWIKNCQKKLCRTPNNIDDYSKLTYRTFQTCAENCKFNLSKFGYLGCNTLGPVLIGFSIWLNENLKIKGIKDVYFFSRDGYMMKKAFEILYPNKYKTHYLYCSRRAYCVPLLWKHPDFEDIFKYISIPRLISIYKFLLIVGLEPHMFKSQVNNCGLSFDEMIPKNEFFASNKVRMFYNNIKEYVIKNSKKEFNILIKYILSFNMDKNIAVIDIGYHGTMQNALKELTNEIGLDINITGLYIMINPNAELIKNKTIDARGYVNDNYVQDDTIININHFTAIFESIFLAHHGSVINFKILDDNILPVFNKYEYLSNAENESNELVLLNEYQNGALALVNEINNSFFPNTFFVTPKIAFFNLIRMGINPTLWEAKTWGDFDFYDITYMKMARPKSILKYFKNPIQLKKDFEQSAWRIGFVKRLFKIKLPYSSLLKVLSKLKCIRMCCCEKIKKIYKKA